MHEYLKSIIEKLHIEGKITEKEYEILIKAVDELKEEQNGRDH